MAEVSQLKITALHQNYDYRDAWEKIGEQFGVGWNNNVGKAKKRKLEYLTLLIVRSEIIYQRSSR